MQNQIIELLINILFFWNTLRGAGQANLCQAVVLESDASSSLPVRARRAGILITSLGSGWKVPVSALVSESDGVCSASKNTTEGRERGF